MVQTKSPPIAIHSILNTCPNSDLSFIHFSSYIKTVQGEISQSSDQYAILNNGTQTCISEWKVPYVGSMAYNPLSLPSAKPGTEPLTNRPGNAFTTMGSPTTTLSLFPGYTSTITFAHFNAKVAGADLNSVAASFAVVVATGGGGAVAGTGTPASTNKPNSGLKTNSGTALMFLMMTFIILGVQ
jgi:hypothetical protein